MRKVFAIIVLDNGDLDNEDVFPVAHYEVLADPRYLCEKSFHSESRNRHTAAKHQADTPSVKPRKAGHNMEAPGRE